MKASATRRRVGAPRAAGGHAHATSVWRGVAAGGRRAPCSAAGSCGPCRCAQPGRNSSELRRDRRKSPRRPPEQAFDHAVGAFISRPWRAGKDGGRGDFHDGAGSGEGQKEKLIASGRARAVLPPKETRTYKFEMVMRYSCLTCALWSNFYSSGHRRPRAGNRGGARAGAAHRAGLDS